MTRTQWFTLLLAALLWCGAASPAAALQLVEDPTQKPTGQQQGATDNQPTQQRQQSPASGGAIRTEDGTIYTVPKATDGSGQEKPGGVKQQ